MFLRWFLKPFATQSTYTTDTTPENPSSLLNSLNFFYPYSISARSSPKSKSTTLVSDYQVLAVKSKSLQAEASFPERLSQINQSILCQLLSEEHHVSAIEENATSMLEQNFASETALLSNPGKAASALSRSVPEQSQNHCDLTSQEGITVDLGASVSKLSDSVADLGSSSSSLNSEEDPVQKEGGPDWPSDELWLDQQFDSDFLKAIQLGDRNRIQSYLKAKRDSSLILQRILTFSYLNRLTLSQSASGSSTNSPMMKSKLHHGSAENLQRQALLTVPQHTTQAQATPYFKFDSDIQNAAHELLGTSVTPLNYVHIACMLGEEEIASDIVQFVYHHTSGKHKKLLLMEFLGKAWGDGNTALHLASFQGMADFVQLLLDCGANPHKRNGRGYRPVDCADDDTTRQLFRAINEIERLPSLQVRPSSATSIKDTVDGALLNKSMAQQSSPFPKSPLTPLIEAFSDSPTLVRISSKISTFEDYSNPVHSVKAKEKEAQTDSINSDASVVTVESSFANDFSRIDQTNTKTPSSDSHKLPKVPVAVEQSHQSPRRLKVLRKTIKFDKRILLLDYCKLGDVEGLKALMEAPKHIPGTRRASTVRIDVNYHHPNSGLTALHLATAYGNLDIVKILIEELQADVNTHDKDGWTILHSLITEIPSPLPSDSPLLAVQKEAARKKRRRFIAVLEYLLNECKDLKLDALNYDGESVVEMVAEDESTGELDAEVLEMVSKAHEHYLATHPTIAVDETCASYDDESDTASSTPPRTPKATRKVPLKSILKKTKADYPLRTDN